MRTNTNVGLREEYSSVFWEAVLVEVAALNIDVPFSFASVVGEMSGSFGF